MRKPGRGQILENRLVGPREVLGGGDRRVPAKGRGRTAPCRGRSGASWIWATPLTPARARGSSVRATHSKNISLFTERRTSERAVSKDGYSSFLFNPLWGFPVVAAGILFFVDHSPTITIRSSPERQQKTHASTSAGGLSGGGSGARGGGVSWRARVGREPREGAGSGFLGATP